MNTAVLFETFARPQYARQVFDQIKKAKPKKLYFYSNKARMDRPDEVRNNEEIRSWVKEVDWDCELHTFFREEYVDVYTSVRGAMDWVFENEEQAIILEDDCVPSVAFFDYCDFFLKKYRDDKHICHLSGACYVKDYRIEGYDHVFCNIIGLYGFATWRDRWLNLDFNIASKDVLAGGCIDKYYPETKMNRFFYEYISNISDFLDRTHCWDYVLWLNEIKNGYIGVYPVVNLVRNIGAVGTHTNETVLRLVDTFYQKDNYPFVEGNRGVEDKYFQTEMFKFYRPKKSLLIKKVMKSILGDNNYKKIKSLFCNTI